MRYAIENPYAFEAEEARDAARFDTGPCASTAHDWARNHNGGGTCLVCGDTVSGADL